MIISVKVKPGSKKGDLLEQTSKNEYTAFLRARAHDGEANTALVKLLADFFNVPKTSIRIKSGATSRTKLIEL